MIKSNQISNIIKYQISNQIKSINQPIGHSSKMIKNADSKIKRKAERGKRSVIIRNRIKRSTNKKTDSKTEKRMKQDNEKYRQRDREKDRMIYKEHASKK